MSIKNRHKSSLSQKEVSLSVLEARLQRATRPKDRSWALVRVAERLAGKEAIRTERALLLFGEAERLAGEVRDQRALAAAIRGAGNCQFHLFNLPAALDTLKRALPIAEEIGDAECEILILRDMGQVYTRQSRQDLALAALQQCAELAELIGNTRVQAAALDLTGTTLMTLGEYERAVEYHTKSLTLLEHTNWTRDKAIKLLNLSYPLRHLGRYAEALSAIERSIVLCRAEQDNRMEGICQLATGVIYSEIGDYPNALFSLIAASKTLERVGDKLNLAVVYANLMDTNLKLGDTERIAEHGRKALAAYEEIADMHGQIAVYGNLSKYYSAKGQKAQAKRLLKQCLTLSREMHAKDYETSSLTSLAILEMDIDNFPAAEKLFQRALDVANTTGNQDSILFILLGLGELFNKQSQPDRAIPFLNRAITIAEKIHSRHHEQAAHERLAGALETKGDFKDALIHWRLASSMKEEILGAEKQKAVTELQIRSNIEKSEAEKALLRKETEFKSQEMEKIAMALAEKTETVRSVRRRIEGAVKLCSPDKRPQFKSLLRDLERERSTIRKTVFNNEFQLVHRNILQKLSKRYPDLSSTERKVCLLLREQFTIKEMAGILKVSTRTVQEHRYQIRKKMKVGAWKNLTTVLMTV